MPQAPPSGVGGLAEKQVKKQPATSKALVFEPELINPKPKPNQDLIISPLNRQKEESKKPYQLSDQLMN